MVQVGHYVAPPEDQSSDEQTSEEPANGDMPEKV